MMDELGTPAKPKGERMGREDGSVAARYSHVTSLMRRQLCDDLNGVWLAALAVRAAMDGRSPVGVLDRLLRPRKAGQPTAKDS